MAKWKAADGYCANCAGIGRDCKCRVSERAFAEAQARQDFAKGKRVNVQGEGPGTVMEGWDCHRAPSVTVRIDSDGVVVDVVVIQLG